VDEATEQAVIAYAVDLLVHGQTRTSNELRKKGIFVSGTGKVAPFIFSIDPPSLSLSNCNEA
jgi:hypothetical protein